MSEPNETPVLIVGAGPAGATAAIELARRGVESLVVERRTRGSVLPRATGISTGSMELLRSWGLEDEVRAGAVDVEWLGLMTETLADAAAGSAFPVGFPTRAQAALLSPTGPACAPQDHLEPILRRHLRERGTRLELGTEVIGVRTGPDGVEAVLRDVVTGERRRIRARYLVAADGARSSVREQLGVAMRGPGRVADCVAALFRAPLWERLGDIRHVIYCITGVDTPGTFVPSGVGDRWLYAQTWDPEAETLADYPPERFTALIRHASGHPDLQPEIGRIGGVAYVAGLADRFRVESAFLIGDAAHRVSPRGATGMNTAIRDGHDLGWKLAWVLRGWAEPELLDSFEAERRPVAAHNVARSADPSGSVRDAAGEVHADLGGRIAHTWVADGVSTLDLLGPGLTLFTGPEGPGIAEAGRRVPTVVRRLDAIAARALGIRGAGTLLARPDGAPVALWPGNETDRLSAVLSGGIGTRGAELEPVR